jgi:hypothetical protein
MQDTLTKRRRTVFKLDKTDKETVLYRFTGGADGGAPVGRLVLDATAAGGSSNNGTVFEFNP